MTRADDLTRLLARVEHAPSPFYRERLAEGERAPAGRPLVEIVTALGPDCLAVGQEGGAPVSREYWQCLTNDARLVLLYHDSAVPDDTVDGEHGAWFLQGWWD